MKLNKSLKIVKICLMFKIILFISPCLQLLKNFAQYFFGPNFC
jgi:hypothetical protein